MTKPLCKAVISDCCSSNRQGGATIIEKAVKPISPGTVVSIEQNVKQPRGVAF